MTLDAGNVPVAIRSRADHPNLGDVVLPGPRVIIEVDAFSPGAAVQPFAANLLEGITSRKLKVDRILPLHGGITPYAEFLKAVPKKGE